MIIGVYKPVKENKKVTSYSILNIGDLYNKGSQRYKVSYICDGIRCKTPDKIYSITREHLNEKRSKTVNDKYKFVVLVKLLVRIILDLETIELGMKSLVKKSLIDLEKI
jgi:hypothetical protein